MAISPALIDLQPLVGRWRMEIYNALFLPDPDSRVTGPVEIAWIENGRALRIRQGDWANPPAAIWIVGRDQDEAAYSVLYGDDRGESRLYQMSVADSRWQIWRTTQRSIQRYQGRFDSDGSTIRGFWEASADGGATWQHDFNIDYIREQSST